MRRCHLCDRPLHHGVACACQFPRYNCVVCGYEGAARTIMDPRAASRAFQAHYLQRHYKETP